MKTTSNMEHEQHPQDASDPFEPVWAQDWPPAKVAIYIERAMRKLWEPNGLYELRILGSSKGVISGYYDDPKAFGKDAAIWSGRAGVFCTVNPVSPQVLTREGIKPNRLREHATRTTTDADIAHQHYLLVDIDPVRPKGLADQCATHEEHCEASVLQGHIVRYLAAQGWSAPFQMDSGNGAYILVRVDLPNDADTRELLKLCLRALARDFDCEGAHVDPSTFNASRLMRVPGTMNCKGTPTQERPHRRVCLTIFPKNEEDE
jgi:hypothetical protein